MAQSKKTAVSLFADMQAVKEVKENEEALNVTSVEDKGNSEKNKNTQGVIEVTEGIKPTKVESADVTTKEAEKEVGRAEEKGENVNKKEAKTSKSSRTGSESSSTSISTGYVGITAAEAKLKPDASELSPRTFYIRDNQYENLCIQTALRKKEKDYSACIRQALDILLEMDSKEYAAVKKKALEEDKSLGTVIREAIRAYLDV